MQDYDYTIHHIEGKKMLEQTPIQKEGEENKKEDNKNIIMLPEEKFRLARWGETWSAEEYEKAGFNKTKRNRKIEGRDVDERVS